MEINIRWFDDRNLTVEAEIIGQMGIHKQKYPNTLDYPNTYVVCHVASGYSLCDKLEYHEALELARKLQGLAFDFDEYMARGYDTKMKGYKAAKKLINSYRRLYLHE
jgi:hypothetical protein